MRYVAALMIILISAGCSLPRFVVVKDPLTAAEHADLAAIYEEKGEYDLAVREGEEALKSDPENIKALISLGNSHFQKRDFRKAEGFYKKGLKAAPGNGDIMNNLANLYLSMERLEEAESFARQAIEAGGAHLGYYYDTLSVVLKKAGREGEADSALAKSRELLIKKR